MVMVAELLDDCLDDLPPPLVKVTSLESIYHYQCSTLTSCVINIGFMLQVVNLV